MRRRTKTNHQLEVEINGLVADYRDLKRDLKHRLDVLRWEVAHPPKFEVGETVAWGGGIIEGIVIEHLIPFPHELPRKRHYKILHGKERVYKEEDELLKPAKKSDKE